MPPRAPRRGALPLLLVAALLAGCGQSYVVAQTGGGAKDDAGSSTTLARSAPLIFTGTADASAGVSIGGDWFVVANDEDSVLQVYSRRGGALVDALDLTSFLAPEDVGETDLEASAQIGDTIYWITSHGRDSDGEHSMDRHRFFATKVGAANAQGGGALAPAGKPYERLLIDLLAAPGIAPEEVRAASGVNGKGKFEGKVKGLAPKSGGINIEGMCAVPGTKKVLLGFRNPRPRNAAGTECAMLLPLDNAEEIAAGANGVRAVFDEPILLDLGGLGIRAIGYVAEAGEYAIVAGPHDEEKRFALYRWKGPGGGSPVRTKVFDTIPPGFTPEAIVTFPGRREFLVLSDDGEMLHHVDSESDCKKKKMKEGGMCAGKHLLDKKRRTFRGLWVTLE